MANWLFNRSKHTASLALMGGTLVVTRDAAGALSAEWTSPSLPDTSLKTGLAHVGAFAIPASALAGIDQAKGELMLLAKWEGQVWPSDEATWAFEERLHGNATMLEGGGVNIETPGAACWIAPEAVRNHLRRAFPRYYRIYAAEHPPGLYVADTDPI